jgi:hypothetical protein
MLSSLWQPCSLLPVNRKMQLLLRTVCSKNSVCSRCIAISLAVTTPYFYAAICHWAAIFVLSVCSACSEAAERCPMEDVDVQDVPHCVLLYSRLIWLMPVQNESGKWSFSRGHLYTEVVVRRIGRGLEKRERVTASGRCGGVSPWDLFRRPR